MTLSFTAHWHDELLVFIPHSKPTPLHHSCLVWHNDSLANVTSLSHRKLSLQSARRRVWGGNAVERHAAPLLRFI